ncbi:hypothetical protein DYB25_012364 [Aphanomyces astaci]|uniref:Uncharacterized protein n=1 Tax=Aphanomyces astaci TaxID=112090 RepID=A0A397A5F3_APHAT|nr:hypothetical protein DYB36_010249 [Aphanomyces astaci]RHY25675.1 hypothetical protein DYB25_012364 [Aphanomyces astaci]RHY39354.1 hypothetical protein DYB30_003419 [Aphanomyces astaci]RHY49123.1 hypothetical protein DYB34_009494 [Aphanomyces astaci]RHY60223.1 hypothetical protein DYB38_008879 [Aphanomyces astaci]
MDATANAAGVCVRQSAKLEELMNYLQFAALDIPSRFRGRVQLRWTAYGSLKSFADSFDFSVEKWAAFYAHFGLEPDYVDQIQCHLPCCAAPPPLTDEQIDANWNMVCDSMLIPAACQGLDWQLVTSMEVSLVPQSPPPPVTSSPSSSDVPWYERLHLVQVQDTVKRKMVNLKEYAEKLLVESLDAVA